MRLWPRAWLRCGRVAAPPSELIAEHLKRFPGFWHVVHEPEKLEWPPPRRFGAQSLEFALPEWSSQYGVLELPHGSVYGVHGWVLSSNGSILPELSWYGGPSERIVPSRPLPEPVRLKGTCLSLVSDWSCRNYSHFVLDGLGRLALFFDAGFSLEDVDHVYCPTPPSRAAAGLLDRLAIPPRKRLWAKPNQLLFADTMLVPSLPATQLTYPHWLARFLKDALVAKTVAPSNRRLYVSRNGYGRQAVREREVENLLVEHGFEIYRASEHDDQPRDFDRAAIVVGPHGAGLANLAFCRPGTRVVEIVPSDNAYPFYYSLAVAAGLDYGYVVGRSVMKREPGAFGPSPYDYEIDLDELRAALA
jgi:hypothetical protein